MRTAHRVGALLTGLLAASVTVSCGPDANNAGPKPTSASSTTRAIAAPVGDPPEQGPRTKTPVRWDPCFAVPDSVMAGQGFDVSTRERSDAINSDYAFIGCQFTRKEDVRGEVRKSGLVTVLSANIGLQQVRDRESEEEISINGHAGILYRDSASESCFVAMPGPDGLVQIHAGSFGGLTDWNACDHIDEIAGAIEPLIPK